MSQIQTFDIPINLRIVAKDETTAELIATQYMRQAEAAIDDPDVIDYELVQFVPSDLAQSCCC